ncbi:MAG: MFS transporter, partial [Pseudomonadota bacterium]
MTHLKRPDSTAKEFPEGSSGYKWRALITVSTGAAMGTMDFSITNISFPVLTKVFQTELATVIWVTLIYTLVCTSLMLILGRMGDLIGRKRIYSTGMAIFTLGLFACSAAHSIGQLIFFRGILALGASMMVSCGAAIVTEAFPPEETGRGLGLFGVAVSIGFIIGPVLGGFLLDLLSWRSIFYVRAPIGLITLILSWTLLKKDRITKGPMRLDILGTCLSSIGLFSMIFGVSQMKRFGPSSLTVLGLITFGLACIVLFILTERRVREPLVDLSLFNNRTFSGAMLSLLLTFVAAPFYILIMPFYLMQGISLSASAAGLLMAVLSLTTIVSGPVSGWLSDRYGAVWFSTSGAWLIAIAFFAMRSFDLQTTV